MTPKHPEGLLDQAAKKFFQYKIENDNHIDDDDDDGDDDDDIENHLGAGVWGGNNTGQGLQVVKARTAENEETPARVRVRSRA